LEVFSIDSPLLKVPLIRFTYLITADFTVADQIIILSVTLKSFCYEYTTFRHPHCCTQQRFPTQRLETVTVGASLIDVLNCCSTWPDSFLCCPSLDIQKVI